MGWKDDKNLGPWDFTRQSDKPSYNEGDHIATYESPVWSMAEGSNTPITPTHKPCGYWTHTPLSPPPYCYFGSDVNQVVRFNLNTRAIDYLTVSTINLIGAGIDRTRRKAIFGRYTGAGSGKIVFIDLESFTEVGSVTLAADEAGLTSIIVDETNGIAYVIVWGWMLKLDIPTMTRIPGRLALSGGTLASGYGNEAGNDSSFVYWADSSFGPKLYRIQKSNFSEGLSVNLGTGGNWNAASGIGIIDRGFLYLVLRANMVNYDRLVKVNLSSFSMVGLASIDFGAFERYSFPVLDKINKKIYVAILTTPWPPNDLRIIKFDLETFTREATLVIAGAVAFTSGATLYDESRDYIYLPSDATKSIVRVNGEEFSVKDTVAYSASLSLVSGVIEQ